MDGGGLAINDKGPVQTVWRRQSKIYSLVPAEFLEGTQRSKDIRPIYAKDTRPIIYPKLDKTN
jgi:hypothetical protein